MEGLKNSSIHPALAICSGPKEHEELSSTNSFPSSSSTSFAGIHPSPLTSVPAGFSVHPQLSIPAGVSGATVLSAPTGYFPITTTPPGFVPVHTFTRVPASKVDTPSATVVSARNSNRYLTTATTKRPPTPPQSRLAKKARKNPKSTAFSNGVNSRFLDGSSLALKIVSGTTTRRPRGWHEDRVVRKLLPAPPRAFVGGGFGQMARDAGAIGWGIGGGVAEEFSGETAGEVAGEFAGELAGDVAGEVAGEFTGELAGELAGGVAGEVGDVYGEGHDEEYGEQYGGQYGEESGAAYGEEYVGGYSEFGERLGIYREEVWRGFW